MAKKKVKKEENLFMTALEKFGSEFILGTLGNAYENLLKRLQDYAYKTQERLIDEFTAYIVFISGVLMLLAAVVMLMKQYLSMSYGWIFLIVSMLLLIMSYLMNKNIDRG